MAKNPKGGAKPGTQATQPSAPAAPVEGATAVAAPAAQATATAQPKQNGVTRPRSGTATGRVWEIFDALSKSTGKPAARGDVMKQGVDIEKLNPATVATQYGRARKFYGLGRYTAENGGTAAPAAASAEDAADVEIEEGDVEE